MFRFFLVILLLSYILLGTSCYKRKSSLSLLSTVETLISTRPDSALFLLRSFHNNSDEISEIANYALLLTQAEDKNYILHTDDSLIKNSS